MIEYEYCVNRKDNPGDEPNENDKIYLEYCELLMQAKEYGLGYRVEWEDVLYLAPTPIVQIDLQNRFHSTTGPAIRWKGGEEFYFLRGTSFDEKLWKKVVSPKVKAKDIFAIENLEQRRIAYELMDKLKMRELPNYQVLDEVKDDGYGNPMKLISFTLKEYDTPFYYLNCFCATTDREYFVETRKQKCWEAKMGSFGLEEEKRFDKEW